MSGKGPRAADQDSPAEALQGAANRNGVLPVSKLTVPAPGECPDTVRARRSGPWRQHAGLSDKNTRLQARISRRKKREPS